MHIGDVASGTIAGELLQTWNLAILPTPFVSDGLQS